VTTQLTLAFKHRKPANIDADARTLVTLLGLFSDWTTAAQVRACLGWNDRHIRAAAEAADGAVLSGPGSPGYKLTANATPEDMGVVATLESQAKRMLARAVAIRRMWHNNSIEV